jgi:thiamine transport system substrate-binding protein
MTIRFRRILPVVVGCTAATTLLVSCGGGSTDEGAQRVVLLAHDSFAVSPEVLAAFTDSTGIEVEIARSGDAGELVAKAVLTSGRPEGDVLWGVDDTSLARTLEAEVFEPYVAVGSDEIPARLRSLAPDGAATPVDEGDVCVNFDIERLTNLGLEPPRGFDDLIDPRYAGLLVVQSPATSSPGLAFLLATIAWRGEGGWADYWRDLRANDVLVVDGWTDAYYSAFSLHGGERPLVVSYGTSPPAEIVFAEPPLPSGAPAPTGIVEATCYRQVEFAGILRGTERRAAAEQLMDFLVSRRFQEDIPLNMFVYPANSSAELPDVFEQYAVRASAPWQLAPELIATERIRWIDEWTVAALR